MGNGLGNGGMHFVLHRQHASGYLIGYQVEIVEKSFFSAFCSRKARSCISFVETLLEMRNQSAASISAGTQQECVGARPGPARYGSSARGAYSAETRKEEALLAAREPGCGASASGQLLWSSGQSRKNCLGFGLIPHSSGVPSAYSSCRVPNCCCA